MVDKKSSKEFYILRDMKNDDRFGKRYIFSNDKPAADEPQLVIAGTIQVSGDVDLFEQLWPSN